MFSTLKLISSGVSTIGSVKSLIDSCSLHLFYRSNQGEIIELNWRKVESIVKFLFNTFREDGIITILVKVPTLQKLKETSMHIALHLVQKYYAMLGQIITSYD